ncbi:MAG: hypothetical protein QOJ86_2979 [Bradyrhizobium sp.]|jgi:hypothetical protein|nr:hypothetical protein [Bradyrhizobium sp.]
MPLLSIMALGVSAILAWLAWLEYREDFVTDPAKSKSLPQKANADTCGSEECMADRKCSSRDRG